MWLSGQIRIQARPRMLSRGMRPMKRESRERLRLSPRTKYMSLGMTSGVGSVVEWPPVSQQKVISSQGSLVWSGR